ncbi:DUF4912 domain-containing protein [Alicyclobacillus mengziensis]|uniref:DUF4912 domain-containing protein n=1 Tax=Alicyclobacillus mengziensis TaxID=2931921 RepID=A0A9X7Z6W5_9BACL|nr:DUF4912 domain-containing protein [Alicyclobacillus mengziensis]QSO47777.1 DUF4912 domain-containing protein [Alicyclobacillus mengziensis]
MSVHAHQPSKRPRDLYDEHWHRRVSPSTMMGMPVNPFKLFVYWSVDDERRALVAYHFMTSWYDLPLYLCLYDVTDCWFDGYNAPLLQKNSVHADADNWYFQGLTPGRNYIAHLATTTLKDMFTILRSNVISLPPSKSPTTRQIVRFVQPFQERGTNLKDLQPPSTFCCEAEFDGYHVIEPKVVQSE